MEGRGCLRTPQSECDIALHNVDINLQTAPPDDQETRRRLSGLQCGWLCARCPSFLSHHNRALSDPVVPGLVVRTLQDHNTPSGPLPERSNPELQRNGNPRHTGEAGRKGIPPHTHTHQRDSYILQNLRNKLFSMCFFKTCLLGVLKALLTYCYRKVQRGREALG